MGFYLFFICFILLIFSLIKLWIYKGHIAYRQILLYTLEFVVIFIFVFRYDVGWDYVNYYHYVADNILNERLEPLSALFVLTAQYFKSPQLLFVLYGTLTYILIFQAIKRTSCNVEFSLLIYLCLFLFDSLGLIRQSLAVALIFWGYRYVYERKLCKYIIVVLIATGFHYSAVIALFIYPLYYIRLPYYVVSLVTLLVMKELLLMIIINEGTYAVYLMAEELMSGGGKVFIFYALVSVFLLYFVIHDNNNKEMMGLYKIILFTFCLWMLLGEGIAIRLSAYYIIYLVLLIPLALRKYVKTRILIGCVLISYFISMLFISSKNELKSPYLPYKNVIFNSGEPFK